jgi:excisionase family DNA binding protein
VNPQAAIKTTKRKLGEVTRRKETDPLYTYDEAARYIGRSRGNVSALLGARQLHPVRTYAGMRIPQSQLDRWIRRTYGNVEIFKARLADERTEELREQSRRVQHEADEMLKRECEAPSRHQLIVWRNARREIKRLRKKAEAIGLGGLFPAHPSAAEVESWRRRLG